MRDHGRIVRAAAALATAAALVATGCRSTVAGTAGKATDQQPDGGVTVALLDPGIYPTSVVPLSLPRSDATGVIVEGQRIADNVVVPSEVDASLRKLGGSNTGPAQDPQALRADLGLRGANIAASHRFIAGFSTSRSTEGGPVPETSLVNLVMRFADPGNATAAAAEMAAAEPTQRRMPIPRYPDAAALRFDIPDGVIVESFTARGPYVLYQWVHTKKPADTATGLIAGTLDQQRPRIDRFVPTEPSQLAALPVDPTGLLAHTLPPSPDAASPDIGVYSAPAALHFQTDPLKSAALFTAAGVQYVSVRRTTMVYQAKDPGGAADVVGQLADDEVAAGATPAEGVAGLPSAKCVSQRGDRLSAQLRLDCYARVGRYAFKVSSDSTHQTRQQAAAQYLILNGLP